MSRSSKKRNGRPKKEADASRRITKRKIRPSNKKLQRKLRRVVKCCICMNTQHGARKILHCGHIFHKECIKQWLKEMARNCPACRRDVPRNTGRHQRADPENRLQPPTNRRSLILRIPAHLVQSRNRDNRNTDLNARSVWSHLFSDSYNHTSSGSSIASSMLDSLFRAIRENSISSNRVPDLENRIINVEDSDTDSNSEDGYLDMN